MPTTIDEILGTIQISDQFDINSPTSSTSFAPIFENSGDDYTLSFTNLENVTSFDTFVYEASDVIDNRYITTTYRISRDLLTWTEWFPLDGEIDFPPFNPNNKLHIDIRWTREGSSDVGDIRLLSYNLNGTLQRDGVDLVEGSFVGLNAGETKIIGVPYIFKIFKVTDIEVLSSNNSELSVEWRFSQDNSRSWSNYEPFTLDNVISRRINSIRFFR